MMQVGKQSEIVGLAQAIERFDADILGLSLDFDSLDFLAELSGLIGQPRPGRLVVCGNILATFNVEYLLERYPSMIIVRGSGELPMAGLVNYRLGRVGITGIPSIAYSEGGNVHFTALESSPIGVPRRQSVRRIRSASQGRLYLEASRGCPYRCDFCAQRKFFNSVRVEQGAGALEADIRQLVRATKGNIRLLDYVDEDLLANPDTAMRVAAVVSRLKAAGVLDQSVKLMCCLSVRSVLEVNNLVALKQLALAGLDRCFIGVESFSDAELQRMGKAHSAAEATRALELLRSVGVEPADIGFVMFGPETELADLVTNCRTIGRERLETEISNPLHQWRALVGTNMCKRLTGMGLVREAYDPNWLTHDWVYADSRVAEIVKQAKKLESRLASVGFAVKKLYRSEDWCTLPDDTKHFVIECKKKINSFLLDFLETAAIAQRAGKPLPAIMKRFLKKAEMLLLEVAAGREDSAAEVRRSAKIALEIDRLQVRGQSSLLLPQDEPKGCKRGS
jgi:radical SAM superfamily enzyme YgiQ (UPF0313 family)